MNIPRLTSRRFSAQRRLRFPDRITTAVRTQAGRHAAVLAVLASVWAVLGGCGGGSDSLTGGSIPTGTVSGTVVRAAATDQPLADVDVQIVLPDGEERTVQTDSQGMFRVEKVPQGDIVLHIRPRPGHGVHPRDVMLTMGPDEEAVVVIPLTPETTPIGSGTGQTYALTPRTTTLRIGQSQTFDLTPVPPADMRPVWIVHGNIGTMCSCGMFTARRVGRGTIVVLVGNQRLVAEVHVIMGHGRVKETPTGGPGE